MDDSAPLFLLTHQSLVSLGASGVLAYVGIGLLWQRDGASGSRSLAALLLTSALQMGASGLWDSSYDPIAGSSMLAAAIGLRYLILFWLVDFSYRFVVDARPRERRWVMSLLGLLIAPFVAAALARIGEPGAAYQFGSLSHWANQPSPLAAAIATVARPEWGRLLLILGYGWAISVLVRKWLGLERTRRSESNEATAGLRAALSDALRPRSRDARAIRAFAALALALFMLELASTLGIAPHMSVGLLFISCAVVWVHVSHSTAPTSLRFKLVALPLAVVVGLSSVAAAEIAEDRWIERNAELRREAERVLERVAVGTSDGEPLTAQEVSSEVALVLYRPGTGAHTPAWRALYLAPDVDLDEVNAVEAREESWRAGHVAAAPEFAQLPVEERRTAALRALRRGERSRWSRVTATGVLFLGAVDEPRHRYVTWQRTTDDGLYVVGFPELARRRPLHELASGLAMSLGVVALALLLGLPLLFRESVLGPVAELLAGVRRVERGDLTGTIDVRTSDELGRLARAFDSMVASVRDARESLERVNRAAFRFVPRSFLRTLGHESIVDVELGDQTERTMTVMFADIRGFTTLCESLTPDETIRFVNDLLAHLGPVVRRHGGFIDKYLGDAIMALFDGGPAPALAAAVDLRAALDEFNTLREQAGEAPVRVGIGLHHGRLMLGIVGEAERIDGTVLADAVNIAARMEGLTKRYGAAILTTRETLELLPQDHGLDLRPLELVRIKGREAPLWVFEVFSGDPPARRDAKRSTAARVESAVRAISKSRFDEARTLLDDVLQADPDDPVLRLHHARVTAFLEHGPPDDWDGAHRMDRK